MRYQRLIPCMAVSLCAFLLAGGVASAVVVPVTLNMTAPGSGINQLTLTVSESALGTSDTKTANVTGYLNADLNATFGAGPGYTATVTQIGFPLSSPGHLLLSNTTFNLVGGLVAISVQNLQASPITPPYPPSAHGYGAVSSGSFAVSAHELQMNSGTITAPAVGTLFPGIDMNLATTPQNSGALSGPNGTIAVTKASQTASQVTYNVDFTLPVSFSQALPPPPDVAQGNFSGNGTLHATGSFIYNIPIPEPGTFVMLLGLVAGLVGYSRLRRRGMNQ
jgi:hypothetical protein